MPRKNQTKRKLSRNDEIAVLDKKPCQLTMNSLPLHLVEYIMEFLPYWRDKRNFEYAFSVHSDTFPPDNFKDLIGHSQYLPSDVQFYMGDSHKLDWSEIRVYDAITRSYIEVSKIGSNHKYVERVRAMDAKCILDGIFDRASKVAMIKKMPTSDQNLGTLMTSGLLANLTRVVAPECKFDCPLLAEHLAKHKHLRYLEAKLSDGFLDDFCKTLREAARTGVTSQLEHLGALEITGNVRDIGCLKLLKNLKSVHIHTAVQSAFEKLRDLEQLTTLKISNCYRNADEHMMTCIKSLSRLESLTIWIGLASVVLNNHELFSTGIRELGLIGMNEWSSNWSQNARLISVETLCLEIKTAQASFDVCEPLPDMFPALKHWVIKLGETVDYLQLTEIIRKLYYISTKMLKLRLISFEMSELKNRNEIPKRMFLQIRAIFPGSEIMQLDRYKMTLFLHNERRTK